jgi:hypothetical protein
MTKQPLSCRLRKARHFSAVVGMGISGGESCHAAGGGANAFH